MFSLQQQSAVTPPVEWAGWASVMLSFLSRAFGRRLLQRRTPRPTSGQARPRPRSCRASSTTCTSGSGGNPLASPPRSPDDRGPSYRGSSTWFPCLVAAAVVEVCAEHPLAVADECIVAVPLVDAEVHIEAVGDGVPGHLPAHPSLQARDVRLLRA